MAGTCCGRRAARVTIEDINAGIGDLRETIEEPSGAAGLERDPNCACDPCMCPSDDVPCNARYLGDDLSDRGLKQALDRLVRHARQLQAARGDACDCADRPPWTGEPEIPERSISPPSRIPTPLVIPPRDPGGRRGGEPFVSSFFRFPAEVRNRIYEEYFVDTRRVLTEIAAVRVRQDAAGSETRIRRYLNNAPRDRERRRFVLDHRYQHQRAARFGQFVTNADRERAAITYEVHASDEALAELPSDPLALLRVSRQVRYEASAHFFQSFRFTHPRAYTPSDGNVHHGILAAEAFFTDRSDNERRHFRHIELDLGTSPPLRGGPTSDIENETLGLRMMRDPPSGAINWTNGLDRLGILSNILRQMEFPHLSLNFTGRPGPWWQLGVTDPRNRAPRALTPVAPWAVDLFNIGPRNRLRLQMHFQYIQNDQTFRNIDPVYNAIHTLSIIRRFLLINAQAMGDQYAGIRVLIWTHEWVRGRRYVEVLVECDDQYVERGDSIVSRLQDRIYGVEGEMPAPNVVFNAVDRRPPYVAPMPPPPDRPEGTPWDAQEDEDNPSILGP